MPVGPTSTTGDRIQSRWTAWLALIVHFFGSYETDLLKLCFKKCL